MLAMLSGRAVDAAAPLRRAAGRGLTGHDPERLLTAAGAALLTGDVRAACRAGWRAAQQSGRTNTAAHHRAVLALAASVQGPLGDVADHARAALATARRHFLAQPVTLAEWALARAELAAGRPADAAGRLRSLLASADGGAHFALRGLVLPTLVEAAAGAGDHRTARAAVPELTSWSRSASDPQGPALLLRCHALLASTDAETDARFRRAHAAHRRAGGSFESARTLLLHGKWLRRRRRPSEARRALRDALQVLERCGAAPWVELARAELRAAGAAQDAPTSVGLAGLTPHQARIASCVAAGQTNREIAERLSVSVRTVDCHLRNIFVTLRVRSRVELAQQVSGAEPA
ncbi:helix-turn-helix transcriptional regulator [Isoptericola croceus]|uniref:helix-turn-helix transcriptional regulator n=1 Tax=Isoptericola croceus TaxID=3031406 RepID=UPI0023F622F8|nr:LuxR family transcriptional regulator [Isoptericola croceus]